MEGVWMTTQAMEALALGEERRLAAAHWRRGVRGKPRREGLLELADALRSTAAPGSLPLMRFLTSPYRVGPAKAAAVMSAARLPASAYQVRDLTEPERLRLAAVLERCAGGRIV